MSRTLSDDELAYWLGVLFAARKRGDETEQDRALSALDKKGVHITFVDALRHIPQSNNDNATRSSI